MKRVLVVLVSSIILIVLAGCETPYGPTSLMGGFSETQVAPDVFSINFRGNGFTTSERSWDFVMLRAAELTLQNSFRYFAVVREDASTEVSAFTMPGYASTSIQRGRHGLYGYTSYTPPTTSYVSKPRNRLLIRCSNAKPEGGFDAEFIVRSIGGKYRVKNLHIDPDALPPEQEDEPGHGLAEQILNPVGILPRGHGGAGGRY
jgi:hypothetical protein